MTLPLHGTRVIVTAEPSMGSRLASRLTDLGADPVMLPCIRVLPGQDPDRLAAAVARLHEADWLVLTSGNGADALCRELAAQAVTLEQRHPRIAVIGPSTGQQLTEQLGFPPDLAPPEAHSESLAAALIETGVKGRSVLLVQSELAGPLLEDALAAAGARVERVEGYRTVEEVESPAAARETLARENRAVLTFMSASAVRALASCCGNDVVARQRIVCIGPVTALEVESLGGAPRRVAAPHTLVGLVGAVVEEVQQESGGIR